MTAHASGRTHMHIYCIYCFGLKGTIPSRLVLELRQAVAGTREWQAHSNHLHVSLPETAGQEHAPLCIYTHCEYVHGWKEVSKSPFELAFSLFQYFVRNVNMSPCSPTNYIIC